MIQSHPNEVIEQIYHYLEENFQKTVSRRRYLHANPELSFEETETAKFIAEQLKKLGLQVECNIGGNGVIGILKGSLKGKTIVLRADFDALPINDEKQVAYKSTKKGVMHACGHDGHTAALLGVAEAIVNYKESMAGTILFVFQPAEEMPPGGAKEMIAEGILDNVDYVFGAHLDTSTPVGKIAIGEGYKMAAVDKFTINIIGKGGHGAKPHEAIDSIIVGTDIVNGLQKIVSRKIDPLSPSVITIGVFHAGSAFNIIADTATLEGTVRTFAETIRAQIKNEIHQTVESISKSYNATVTVDYLLGYPALYNHPEITREVTEVFLKELPLQNVVPLEASMGAEDFSYFLLEKPGTYFKVGARNENESTQFPHHHPKFDFDETALLITQKAFVKIISHFLLQSK